MARVSDARERLLQAALVLIWESSYGSTSVDAICQRAQVNKGSFYHFFHSKEELAVATLDREWAMWKQVMDTHFSPLIPPLERFTRMHAAAVSQQEEMAGTVGFVVGCPLFSLGSEVGTQHEMIRQKVDEILGEKLRYLESTIAEAHARKMIHAPEPTAKARILLSYIEGQMTRARIENSLIPIHEIEAGVLDILGVATAMTRP